MRSSTLLWAGVVVCLPLGLLGWRARSSTGKPRSAEDPHRPWVNKMDTEFEAQ